MLCEVAIISTLGQTNSHVLGVIVWCHIHDKLQTPLWDHIGLTLKWGCEYTYEVQEGKL